MGLVLYMLIMNIVAMNKDKPVNYFGYSYSYVPTSSMEPTIKQGDTIIFKKVSYSQLKVGDIIVYKSKTGEMKGKYIVHRINNKYEDGFEMIGDNNPSVDSELVTEDMLIGKYVRTFNFLNLGKLSNHKNIVFALLFVFFLVIIILESINIMLQKSKEKLKKESDDKLRQELLDEMRQELLEELKNKQEE